MTKKLSAKKAITAVKGVGARACALATGSVGQAVKNGVVKHRNVLLAILGTAVVCCAVCGSGTSKSIGVVDLEKIKNTADIYHLIRQEQGKNEHALQVRFDVEKRALVQEENLLMQKRASLSKEAFEKAVQQLQQKVRLLQAAYQMDVERILKASHTVVIQVNEIAMDILPDVAKSTGYEVILPKQGVWYATDAVDMTDVLVKELNKRTTKLVYPVVEFK